MAEMTYFKWGAVTDIVGYRIMISLTYNGDVPQVWSTLNSKLNQVIKKLFEMQVEYAALSIGYKKIKKWPLIEICLVSNSDDIQSQKGFSSLNLGDIEIKKLRLNDKKDDQARNRLKFLNWFINCLEKPKGGTINTYLTKYVILYSTFLISGKEENNERCRWLTAVFNGYTNTKRIICFPRKKDTTYVLTHNYDRKSLPNDPANVFIEVKDTNPKNIKNKGILSAAYKDEKEKDSYKETMKHIGFTPRKEGDTTKA